MFGVCYLACMSAFLSIAIIAVVIVSNKAKKQKKALEVLSKSQEAEDTPSAEERD